VTAAIWFEGSLGCLPARDGSYLKVYYSEKISVGRRKKAPLSRSVRIESFNDSINHDLQQNNQ